ncbi:MAG: fatty acid desaturase, partial [Bacteroidota bacterium]
GLGMGPYILMLHNTSHRKFFKPEFQFLNHYIPWVLGPFIGQSPETYFGHHIGMHHAENNLEEDRSSTMKYQRDKLSHFLHYYGTFMAVGIIHVADYFIKKKRQKFVVMVIRGELTFFLLCIGLSFISFPATLFVFILPIIIARFGMMSGNWAQHAFIHQDKPGNSWVNSITCINTGYNRKCFNDGYHIGHHLSPHRHWTDMPADFLKNKDKYVENEAIVFDGLDYFQIWFFLVTKNYKKLAKHFVNINDHYKSDEEIIGLLKSRTQQFTREQRMATLREHKPHHH